MKYFTKDWYQEMQVRGFLVFPETEQDWEESKALSIEHGWNFEENCRESLEYRKNDLLKFLPTSFHPYINDGTLNSKFPSVELRQMIEQWKNDYEQRMKKIGNEYHGYYLAIKDSLPKSVVQLYEKSLHDAKVLSFEMSSEDTFTLTLDCRGGFHYHTDVKFIFTGVKNVQLSELTVGSYWIYDEVYATETGFELHVLFDSPLTEFSIVADNVLIEVIGNIRSST